MGCHLPSLVAAQVIRAHAVKCDLSPESMKDRASENLGVQGVGLAAEWLIERTPGPDQP